MLDSNSELENIKSYLCTICYSFVTLQTRIEIRRIFLNRIGELGKVAIPSPGLKILQLFERIFQGAGCFLSAASTGSSISDCGGRGGPLGSLATNSLSSGTRFADTAPKRNIQFGQSLDSQRSTSLC